MVHSTGGRPSPEPRKRLVCETQLVCEPRRGCEPNEPRKRICARSQVVTAHTDTGQSGHRSRMCHAPCTVIKFGTGALATALRKARCELARMFHPIRAKVDGPHPPHRRPTHAEQPHSTMGQQSNTQPAAPQHLWSYLSRDAHDHTARDRDNQRNTQPTRTHSTRAHAPLANVSARQQRSQRAPQVLMSEFLTSHVTMNEAPGPWR